MKTNRASFSLWARQLAAAMALLQLTTLLPTAAYAQTVTDTDIVRRQSQYASVQQAVYQLVAEATDTDADGTVETPVMKLGTGEGPSDGGVIPDASGAPKTDGFGGALGYCSWDNGVATAGVNYLPGGVAAANRALAVISYGLDNTFQTTCADAATGSMVGDDYLFSMTLNQVSAGASATVSLYWGAPVASLAALNALNTAAIHDGEARITKDNNQVYRWNLSNTAWERLGAGGSQNWSDSGVTDAYILGKAAVGQGAVGAEALVANGGAGVAMGLLGSGTQTGVNIYNTAGNTVNAFLGYDNTASKLVLSAQSGVLSIQLGGSERMVVGADGSLALNGATVIDASRNLSAVGGTFSGAINSASVQVGGATVIDASRNIANVGNVTAAGTVEAAAFKINGVTVMDNSGAGSFASVTSTGNVTVGGMLTSTGTIAANGGITTTGLTSSGQVLGPVGTVGAPAFSFTGRTNTGVYSPAAATLGLTAGGAQVLQATATNLTLPVGLTVSGGDLVLSGPNISGTLAARPVAGIANRIYLATDTNEIYRDTGATWVGTGVSWSNVSSVPAAISTYAVNMDQNVRTTDSPTFSRLTSTVATGTAPFTVASTTAVTNLNADLLDGQHGAYYRDATNLNAGTVAVARGGTGLGTTPTNGQLLIGNGTNYTLAGITAGNGVSVTNGAGSITVGLPNVGVAGTYGSAATVPVVTTDAQGRITGVVNTAMTPAWANITGKPTTLGGYVGTDSITANPGTRVGSGFYENSAATTANGWPVTNNSWYHLMASTHSNVANYYSMQLAADFFAQDLYYRSTNNSGATAWNKVLHSVNAPYALAMDQNVRTTDAPTFAGLTANGTIYATGSITGTNTSNATITAMAGLGGLEARGNGTGAAVLAFHRPGVWGSYLGLDTDNQLKYGGWSFGTAAYVLHSGNAPYAWNMNQNVRTADAPTFAGVYNNDWFRNNNAGQGMYNQATGRHFYSESSAFWRMTSDNGLRFVAGDNATLRGFVYHDSNGFGLLNDIGTWVVRSNFGGAAGGSLYGAWDATNLTIGSQQVLHAGNYGSYALSRWGNVGTDFDISSANNSASYSAAAIELRELNHGGPMSGAWSEAPRLGFHWGGRVASQIAMGADGTIMVLDNPGTGYEKFAAGNIYANGTLNVASTLTFTAANPVISSSSYVTVPGGLYVSGGTAYFQNQLQARGGVNNDSGPLSLSAAGGYIAALNPVSLSVSAASGGACTVAGAIARDGANDVYVCK